MHRSVVGIDLSTTAMGIAEFTNGDLVSWAHQTFKGELLERIGEIHASLKDHFYNALCSRLLPGHTTIVIEQPFVYKNWKTALHQAYAVGAAIAASSCFEYKVELINPQTRLTVAGIGKKGLGSKDLKILCVDRARVLYGIPDKSLPYRWHDTADAILIAHAYISKARLGERR